MHRIVIVGGGAGGLELATRLGDRLGAGNRAQVTLVDRWPTHVWKPLLHEVAAGSLDTNTHQITFAAHAHWHHFGFVQGEMTGLSRANKEVSVAPVYDNDGVEIIPARTLQYDTLVLALGSRTHFFGVNGAQKNAITLDTLEQAELLRKRLLQACLRKRAFNQGSSDQAVDIAIIGGGATGVELAAELRRMEDTFRQFGLLSGEKQHQMRITLLEAGGRILPALSDKVSNATQSLLERMSVVVSVADPVDNVAANFVKTKSGRSIAADVTIWAAGIKAPDVLSSLDGITVNRINQVKVTQTLQSVADGDIFALGDCASCAWTDDRMVPPRAQAAHQQAVFLFKALTARIRGRPMGVFAYRDHGSLISLGSSTAVGSLSNRATSRSIFVQGLVAKVMYAALYRKHLAAVSGLRHTAIALLAHSLRRVASPRVKLH
ncbi:NAD(P)/FAD-dependent oxidoreductase [Caballeronia sp. LP006]|uniref:NAD(P)/FAD-dependent oxidoreductase n=1 Tax=Caballeronia sp. LP006 TaxID=3038552 RepID=UPI002865382B|nr:NAD(P)/FAD-dependent oxidoreductase [Caballeronia sp. LP006]MDR5832356.1 NAD(P)/FAD-dependent oxidoreductase [Caballeronia sp. LP006]